MTRVIDEHDVTVLLGDVREQLATLPDGSVQCVVTSPPYYGLRDYGVDGQIGLEPSPAEYVETMRAVFADVRRVLAADGVMWLNLGDSYATSTKGSGGTGKSTLGAASGGNAISEAGVLRSQQRQQMDIRRFSPDRTEKNLLGMPWRVAIRLQDDGWTLRNDIIWHKPNAMPESVTDRLSTRYEHVFLFSKSRRYWFDLDAVREPHATADRPLTVKTRGLTAYSGQGNHNDPGPDGLGRSDGGRNPGDVWTIPTSPFPGAHFATMPRELVRRCILAGCPEDGTVLDPFAGSGTTLMTARQLGRKSIGIELNPEYVDIIRDRIGQTPFDFEVTA